MAKKLPDEIACRRFIQQQRFRGRKTTKTKTISITIGYEDGKKVRMLLGIHVHKGTESVSLAHGLGYYKSAFYPSRYDKLSCKTEHGLEELKKKRESKELKLNLP